VDIRFLPFCDVVRTRMKRVFCALCLVTLCCPAFVACGRKEGDAMDVHRLVKLFQQGGGADDVAAEQLLSKGNAARDELIRMLDDQRTSDQDAWTVVHILFVHFQSEESIQAMDRFSSRKGEARVTEIIRSLTASMRTEMRERTKSRSGF